MTQTAGSGLSRAGKGKAASRNGPEEEGWMSLLTYRHDHMEGCFASALGCFYLLALPGCLPHSFHACVAPPASSGGGGAHFQPLPNLQEQIIRPFFWHREKVLKKRVCCNVRVLLLIFALSLRFFFFAHTHPVSSHMHISRLDYSRRVFVECLSFGRKHKIQSTRTITKGDKSAWWRRAD